MKTDCLGETQCFPSAGNIASLLQTHAAGFVVDKWMLPWSIPLQ